jgi:hypothetical protein
MKAETGFCGMEMETNIFTKAEMETEQLSGGIGVE